MWTWLSGLSFLDFLDYEDYKGRTKITDRTLQRSASSREPLVQPVMKELNHEVLEIIEFQHPAKWKTFSSFWHTSITERKVPAKTFWKRFCFLRRQNRRKDQKAKNKKKHFLHLWWVFSRIFYKLFRLVAKIDEFQDFLKKFFKNLQNVLSKLKNVVCWKNYWFIKKTLNLKKNQNHSVHFFRKEMVECNCRRKNTEKDCWGILICFQRVK